MKLIWIRHGETEANASRKYVGHTDSPLTRRGIEQAQALARQLTQTPIDRIFASDLPRAVRTADIVAAAKSLAPIRTPALRELHFGKWEGLTYEAIIAAGDAEDEAKRWFANPFDFPPPGGETLRELGKRVDSWLHNLLLTAKQSETIALVTHGGPIRYFLAGAVDRNESNFWSIEGVPHGGYCTVERDKRGVWHRKIDARKM